jgi:chloramphenicol-sensitive protein RarD
MQAAGPTSSPLSPSGMGLAIACYGGWGLVPIYWKGIAAIPAFEALIARIVWTFLLLWIVGRLVGRASEIWERGGREWLWTILSAGLLAGNWGLFVWAVQSDQIVATSLGYYINPLVSIVLGMLILGERLNPIQSLAVGTAACGVVTLTILAGSLPWISLALAGSFALYGLIHKLHPQPALAGLTREMMLLSPLALIALLVLHQSGSAQLLDVTGAEHAYLSLSSVVTAVPLLLFHAATRRLPLYAVGMFQYIAPTLTLVLAVVVYHEPFTRAHSLGFGFVWLGLATFTFDSLRRARADRVGPPATPDAESPISSS